MAPFSWLLSAVNLMAESNLLIHSRKVCFCPSCWMTNCVIHILILGLGGNGSTEGFPFKILHVEIGYYGAYQVPHSCPLYLFMELPWKEKYVLCRENPNNSVMFCTDNAVVSWNEVSSCSMPCMILSAESTGTDVNSAVTSFEQTLIWLEGNLTCLSTKSLVLYTWCGYFPTKGLSILAGTFATPWVADPLLDTMGLMGY